MVGPLITAAHEHTIRYAAIHRKRMDRIFRGETFRVLKEKEMKQYGEYRTRRLVLEKWDELSSADAERSG